MDVVGREHFLGDIALIDIDVRPLTALRLVAGHGIAVFHLQRAVIDIFHHLFQPLRLRLDIGIIGQNAVVELATLLCGECWSLALQRVEQHHRLQFGIVVVGKAQQHVGKAKTVHLVDVSDATNHRVVAVGNEIQLRFLAPPYSILLPRSSFLLPRSSFLLQILIPHHHQQIARRQFLLATENRVSDARVISICAFVRPRDNNRFVHPDRAVTRRQRLDEFVATHDSNVGKTLELNLWKQRIAHLKTVEISDFRRIPKDAAVLTLPHHL